jgi:outer membrane protein assembly factor BamE (lipoprotein component of BamABCDE complex)
MTLGGVLLVLGGCTANQHRSEVSDDSTGRLTVGIVQKEIRLGMAAAQVAEVLGSPNIVTSDEARRETWVYDKISTEVVYSRSSGAIVGLLFSGSGGGLGAGRRSSGASSTSQRTLTVVIRYDEQLRVRDFSYHASRF